VDRSDPITDARAPRKNLFLAASIRSDSLSVSVRIRNLSETGGLIEAPALPDVGASLTLSRQEVEIGGIVVWRSANRCGIRFEGAISIDDWIAGKCLSPQARSPQAQLDEIQRAIRSGTPVVEASSPMTAPNTHPRLDQRIADEIDYVSRLLQAIGNGLTDDPIIMQRHAAALQSFDTACEILGHLRTVLKASDKSAAVDRITMSELRSRLTRKALF
jgi:hypothetical protein